MSTCNPYEALSDSLKSFSFTETYDNFSNPFSLSIQLCLFLSISTFVVSTASRNYSQVDKLWSIAPSSKLICHELNYGK